MRTLIISLAAAAAITAADGPDSGPGWAAGRGPEVIVADAVTWLRNGGCSCPG